MAKNRELSSIEHGLAEAIKNLKTEISFKFSYYVLLCVIMHHSIIIVV